MKKINPFLKILSINPKTQRKTTKRLVCMLLMALATICIIAQDAVVNFKSPIPMPKEMKGKDWQVFNIVNDELIIYDFKDGKLCLARLDANGNVKQQAEHKNTKYSLMNILSNGPEIAVLTYDSKIGGIP